MRMIVNSTYITLDGVIQNPQNWPSTGGFGDAGNQAQIELLERCDAVLMGPTPTTASPRCGPSAPVIPSATA